MKSRLKRLRKSKKKRTRRGGKIVMSLPYAKDNILLIIDPQNDFSDAKEGVRQDGNLSVPNSSKDYDRMIAFINKNKSKIKEIHVSLDTHTERHIGHPQFWSRVNMEGSVEGFPPTDDTDGLRILSKTEVDHVYKGTSVLPVNDLNVKFNGGDLDRYYTPRKDETDGGQYTKLCEYVKNYIDFYSGPLNKHGQLPWIWRTHCIEGSEGHKVVKELKDCLDDCGIPVKYHIKGQNNLAEMYSIFSAEKPVSPTDAEDLSFYLYGGVAEEKDQDLHIEGFESYNEHTAIKNLDTNPNTGLMDRLLGETNRVLICGQAKTHCVKSSLIDLMEHKNVHSSRIVLLSNMTSPIPGAPDDIESITDKKYTVFKPLEIPTL